VAYWDANKIPMETLIRDICNPEPNDPDFPFARHKDFFDGHSWASGLFQQANGKGQESSSEAVNAYYSVYLYALATANVDLTHFSHLLLSMEVQAAQFYWHMPNDDIYDSVFSASRMVGNIGALDATAATWFGSELEYVHGINIMPVTPATALLIDQAFVMTEWPVLGSRLTPAAPPASKLCAANQGCAAIGMFNYLILLLWLILYLFLLGGSHLLCGIWFFVTHMS
jgi:endo-1,3(4)-beta-glucanase